MQDTNKLTVDSSMKTSVQFPIVIKKANRITGIIRKGTEEKTTKTQYAIIEILGSSLHASICERLQNN